MNRYLDSLDDFEDWLDTIQESEAVLEPRFKQKLPLLIAEKFSRQAGFLLTPSQVDALLQHLFEQTGTSLLALIQVAEMRKILRLVEDLFSWSSASKFPDAPPCHLKKALSSMEEEAQMVINFFLGRGFDKTALSKGLIRAIFVRRDEQRMKELCKALQRETDALLSQLKRAESDQEVKRLNAILGHILALYPFVDPEEGSTLFVPIYLDGYWKSVGYVVTRLEMTSRKWGSPIPAFGLSSQQQGAPSLLLFRGTPHLTAPAFWLAVFSDFMPGYTVGDAFFLKEAEGVLVQWMIQAFHASGPLNIYGISLGGSYALLTLSVYPELIGRAYIYGAPSLMKRDADLYRKNSKKSEIKPEVDIYWNRGDLVPLLGKGFDPAWRIHELIPPQVLGTLSSHIHVVAAFPQVISVKLNIEVENKRYRRKIVHALHQIVSIVVFPFTLLCLCCLYQKRRKTHS